MGRRKTPPSTNYLLLVNHTLRDTYKLKNDETLLLVDKTLSCVKKLSSDASRFTF